jgi:hypothetical protein
VGLTSPRNTGFVADLGCYDTVLSYSDLELLDPGRPTVLVDVAGDTTIRRRVHEHVGDQLTHSLTVGVSHWDAPPDATALVGPTPTVFFAPTQMSRRLAEWGPAGYQKRLTRAWDMLRARASTWLEVKEVCGLDGARRVYQDLLASQIGPQQSYVVLPSTSGPRGSTRD